MVVTSGSLGVVNGGGGGEECALQTEGKCPGRNMDYKKKESLLVLKCCFLQPSPQAIYDHRRETLVMSPPDKMYHFHIIMWRR